MSVERKLRIGSGRLAELHALDGMAGVAGEQFDRIVDLPGVRSVELAGSSLVIQTNPIQIEWENRTYKLGAFKLTLDLEGDVRVDSLDSLSPKSGWDHPHVQAGLPCLGNVRPGLLKLIADYELALAVQLLLDFVSTYQPETAYTPIEGWPCA